MRLGIKIYIFFILTISIGIIFFLSNPQMFAQDSTPTPPPSQDQQRLNDLQGQIGDLEKKIADAKAQEKSLSLEISVMDNQIKLTQLRIDATKQEILVLGGDIDKANKKISQLEKALEELIKVLVNRIISTYQVGKTQNITMLISASNISDFFTRASYLRIVQAHDKKIIYDTQQAKDDYLNQKQIYEDKKAEVEKLKAQLEAYTAQLDQDKKAKQALLEVTQNDEKRYQQLLAQLKAEKSAIEGVVATLQLVNGTPIKEGESIAVVGNSGAPGCSTGPHLHFEVRKNGITEDPSAYLKSGVSFRYSYREDEYFLYGTINPRGTWNWPLSDTIKINQAYGSHEYARRYSDGIHTGIDMESDSSDLIKAPKDGTLYKGSTYCGSSIMNYAAVDHGDGIISWYWHVR